MITCCTGIIIVFPYFVPQAICVEFSFTRILKRWSTGTVQVVLKVRCIKEIKISGVSGWQLMLMRINNFYCINVTFNAIVITILAPGQDNYDKEKDFLYDIF
jgi:hypothetical protein